MDDQYQPPDFLTDTGRAEWNRIIRLLDERGILDPIRRASVEAYATAYERWRACEESLSAATEPAEIDRLVERSNIHQRHLRAHGRDLGLPAGTQVRNKPPARVKPNREEEDGPRRDDINDFFRSRRTQ